jgi:hypothetical protein
VCVKSHFACENRTLHVKINLVRVQITLVRVVHTFVPVEITLRIEITLCIWKSHSACINHTRTCRNQTRECHIHTLMCQNYTRVRGNHNLRVKPHSVGGNCTLRVEITLVRYIQTPYPPPMDPRLLTDQFFEIYIVLWIWNCIFQQLFFDTLKSFETKKSQFNFKT